MRGERYPNLFTLKKKKKNKRTYFTFIPTFVLCVSTRARRSLLERLPRNSLTNLLAYFRLSPQPPHCQALRFSRSGASSHVQRSIRPALHALAKACVRPAEEMAYKKAVSLNPGEAFLKQKLQNVVLYINSQKKIHSINFQKVCEFLHACVQNSRRVQS